METIKTLRPIFVGCVERAGALAYKGKRRDDFAIDYLCGACTALQVGGHEAAYHHLATILTMAIGFRGYREVERCLAIWAEDEAKETANDTAT